MARSVAGFLEVTHDVSRVVRWPESRSLPRPRARRVHGHRRQGGERNRVEPAGEPLPMRSPHEESIRERGAGTGRVRMPWPVLRRAFRDGPLLLRDAESVRGRCRTPRNSGAFGLRERVSPLPDQREGARCPSSGGDGSLRTGRRDPPQRHLVGSFCAVDASAGPTTTGGTYVAHRCATDYPSAPPVIGNTAPLFGSSLPLRNGRAGGMTPAATAIPSVASGAHVYASLGVAPWRVRTEEPGGRTPPATSPACARS